MPNVKALGCPRCGGNKSTSTHSYATYRVYKSQANLKLVCKTCSNEIKFKYIQGATIHE